MEDSAESLSIRREALISAASNVVLVGTNLGTLAVLATVFDSSALGTYFYALSAALIAIIPSRELSEIMRKRVSETDTPNAEYLGLAQYGTLAFLVPFGAVLLLAEPLLVEHTPFTAPTVFAFGAYTATLTQSAMTTRLYDAVGSPGASMVSQAVRETAFVGVVFALVHLHDASAATVLLARAAVHLLASFGIFFVVGITPRLPSRRTLSRGFAFGKWSVPTGLAGRIWSETPTLLMGVLLGGSAVALFETAKRVTVVASYLSTCINDPLLVKASAMDSDDEEILRYVRLALDYTPSVAIPTLFVLAPVAGDVLRASAESAYAGGGMVLVGVALTHILSGMKTPISSSLWGVDRPEYVFYLTFVTLIVGTPAVALGATIGGVEGVVGALIVLGVGEVVGSGVASYLTFDRLVLPRTIHLQAAAGTVAGGFVWAASRLVDVSNTTTLAALLGGGALVHYGLFAIGNGQFRRGIVRTTQEIAGVANTFVHSSLDHVGID